MATLSIHVRSSTLAQKINDHGSRVSKDDYFPWKPHDFTNLVLVRFNAAEDARAPARQRDVATGNKCNHAIARTILPKETLHDFFPSEGQ